MKISVIVPIYNMENFIARTISCLKAQDEPNLEFLLVNDGSTDSTLSLMQEMCAGDARFHIFTTENKGYGHACNFGIRQAAGDFLLFLSRMTISPMISILTFAKLPSTTYRLILLDTMEYIAMKMAHPAFCITGNKILQEGFLTNSP